MLRTVKCVCFLAVILSVSECRRERKGRSPKYDDGKSSLAFVFDVTGSMYNDLRQLREGAEMILNTALKESNVIADFVFVPFHDPTVGPATVTSSKEVFKDALSAVRVYGGGDCPEKSLTGIQLALNVSRPRSFLYVFTDATAGDHRSVAKVLDTVQRKQSQVVFILTGHCNDLDKPTYKVYQKVAAASSGQIFNLRKSSVHKMLEFVKSSIKERTVNLASVTNPAGYNYTQEIPVDSSLGEVTVSVSGAKPNISVVAPSGEQLTGPPKLVTTLDLAEIMVVKVMQPEPGNWKITVGSAEEHSVKVVGLSNLTFTHGFTVPTPTSMHQTSYRPLKGTYNHMLISLTPTNVTASIQYAELVSLDGRTLFEVPLTNAGNGSTLYVTEPFIPPDDFFYIAINGRDEYNQELRRMGSTAVQAAVPDVPYLSVQEKLEARAHSRVILTCDVESLVPVVAMWTKDSARVQPQTSSLQTTSLEYVIEDMREEHVGTYKCVARNVAGVTEVTTDLTVIVEPPQVSIEPQNRTVELGDDVIITCTVYSEALLLENKLLFNGTNTHYAIDVNKEPNIEGMYSYNKTIHIGENDTGIYTCVAANRGGGTNQSIQISTKPNPTAQILGPHTISKPINSDLQLVCAVDNAGSIVWSSPDNTTVRAVKVHGSVNDVLDIRNVTSDGTWMCTAIRGLKTASDAVSVTVLIKPIVSIDGADTLTVLNGTVVSVSCLVSAKPEPRILWHRETEKFLTNTITQIQPNVYNSTLTLNSSAESINGTYFCFGENSEGIHQDIVTINVRRVMTLIKGFTDQSVRLYSKIELPCVIDSYPPAITHWYHNGTSLVTNENVHISEDNTTLYLMRLDFSYLGEYMCEVDNGYEKIDVKKTISVVGLASPLLFNEPVRVTVSEGETTVITCRLLQGEPVPTIHWQYKTNHSAPFTSPSKDVFINGITNELFIPAVYEKHAGIYRCVARNVIGENSYDVTLLVQYLPKLISDLKAIGKPQEVKLGHNVTLSCEARGVPPPLTVWSKDGRPLVFTDTLYIANGSELVITTSATSSGTYTCNATNEIGSTQRNFTLVVYDPPQISSTSSPIQEVLLGELVQLACHAEGLPIPTVQWSRDGQPIDDKKSIDLFSLRFLATLRDAGEYKCIASNEHGNTSVLYTLRVWDPPKLLDTKDQELHVKAGDTATFSCEATGVPSPVTVWSKDGRAVVITDNISLENSSKLVIEGVTVNDSGTFTCNVNNSVGYTRRSYFLNVYEPPKLISDLEDIEKPQEVKLGDNVTLSCEARGVPPPLTVWSKDGRPLVFTDTLYMSNKSALVLEAVSPLNSGTYTCDVVSEVGSASRNFTVVVYDPPKISSNSDLSIEVLEGQLVELPCETQGVPTPTVQWTVNGDPVSYSKHGDQYGLRFVANLTDFGEYNCTAVNVYGTASVYYTLHVWVPPYIKPHPGLPKEVLAGTNVTLQCDVVAFPLPTVQWEFNGELFVENTTDLSFNDFGNIYIRNISFKHEGVYTCVARNLGGVDQRSLYVKVVELPKIIEDNYTGPYIATNLDTVLNIACRATGKPAPYYMWIKDEFYLNNDRRYSIDIDGTLHIKSPTPDLSGNYTCFARNRLGEDNKTALVHIYSIPKPHLQSDQSVTSVTLVEGNVADVECPVTATSHSIKWYKNAKLISSNELHFPNVSRDNATTYSCVVSNAVGSAHSTVLVSVEWSPRFEGEGRGVVERVSGDDCYMHCDVDAKPRAKTRWLYNSKPLLFEDKSTLKLINVQLRNSGAYKCIVSNTHGTVVREFVLRVLEAPFISEFDMMDVRLKEGDNATLECNIRGTPVPSVTWSYNNTNWHVDNTSLSAVNITSRYSGLYRCDAINTVGRTHLVYRVTVVAIARVIELIAYDHGEGMTVRNKLDVVRGSSIRIACKASGNPVPDIQWVRQGRSVGENRYDIDYADLTLNNIDMSQKGVYTCVASNEGGTDDRRMMLDVLEQPKIFQSLFDNTNTSEVYIEVISGQPFYLHCHPYGNPFPEIYWFKDDIPLKLFDETMVSSEFGEVIEVRKALETQSGNYKCLARNSVGNASVSYLVNVLVPPPKFKENSRKVVTSFGKQLVLSCPSMGTRPNVMWIKHPYTEINADDRISMSEDNFTLIVNKTLVSDGGKYSCILTNKVGTTEVIFDVIVQKRPSIAGNVGANIIEGHVVPLRRSIVLKCEVDGYPPPQITWLKDTQELPSSMKNIQRVLGNSLLAVWSVDAHDSGQYICLVENQAGSVHRRYNVAVQVPGKWSAWSPWSLCNVTCGLGYQIRSRLCRYVDDRNKTYDNSTNTETIILDESACKGPSDDRRKCHMPPCEEDEWKARWSQWSKWSECSTSCGPGSQARTRKCKSKAKCSGDNVQIRKCVGQPSCNPTVRTYDSEDIDSDENTKHSSPYEPDMTFESQPDLVESHYSPDIEEFYSVSGSQAPTVFYDVDVFDNLDGSDRGPCDPGYRHNVSADACDDVDECRVEQNQCHVSQACVNTPGAYRCSCTAGFLSLGAGQRCLDINECALGSDGCEFSCVNTAGGYVCACPRHLRLHLDRHHCVTPSLYRRPYAELESDLMSTTINFPTRVTKLSAK